MNIREHRKIGLGFSQVITNLECFFVKWEAIHWQYKDKEVEMPRKDQGDMFSIVMFLHITIIYKAGSVTLQVSLP